MATAIETKTDYFLLATEWLNKVYAETKHNNVNLPLLIWLSANTRLLESHKGKGEVLPHVWLQGRSEIGKTYTMERALALLPESAYVTYQGVSTKLFSQDTADLKHRIAFFEEADSLAQGDESMMAESIRLAMDGGRDFVYKAGRNIGGQWVAKTFVREGPFIVLSTNVHYPGKQLTTRMCVVSMPEPDAKALAERNLIANMIENNGWPEVPWELLKYQEELQNEAVGVGIKVTFSDEAMAVINALAKLHIDSRTFSMIKFLLKSIALMGQRREVLPVDYDTLFDLNRGAEFLTSGLNRGVTGGIRKVCDAIIAIKTAEEDATEKWFRKRVADDEGKKMQTAAITGKENQWFWLHWRAVENGLRHDAAEDDIIRSVRASTEYSKITSNDLALGMGVGPTTAKELIKAAIDEGWVENTGGNNKAKADYKLGPLYVETLAGLPSRDVLMGTN